MVRRWIRAASARIGIRLPFKGAICVQGTQSVYLDSQSHAEIKFRKMLVFLETPEAGDLRDAYPIGNGEATSATIFVSPDAVEVFREERPRGGWKSPGCRATPLSSTRFMNISMDGDRQRHSTIPRSASNTTAICQPASSRSNWLHRRTLTRPCCSNIRAGRGG